MLLIVVAHQSRKPGAEAGHKGEHKEKRDFRKQEGQCALDDLFEIQTGDRDRSKKVIAERRRHKTDDQADAEQE